MSLASLIPDAPITSLVSVVVTRRKISLPRRTRMAVPRKGFVLCFVKNSTHQLGWVIQNHGDQIIIENGLVRGSFANVQGEHVVCMLGDGKISNERQSNANRELHLSVQRVTQSGLSSNLIRARSSEFCTPISLLASVDIEFPQGSKPRTVSFPLRSFIADCAPPPQWEGESEVVVQNIGTKARPPSPLPEDLTR